MRFPLSFVLVAVLGMLPLHATEKLADGVYAEFTTPRGVFTVELDYRRAPLTVASFVGRAEGTLAARNGQPFFTGLKWYRVVPGFVIQSGDPVRSAALPRTDLTDAEDALGHPLEFPDEFAPGLHNDRPGVLSMANGGPDTNSSEFFVTLGDCTRLNYLHSVFGRVFTGLEVLAKIQADDPLSIRILRVGEAARAFKADEAAFQELLAKTKPYAGPAEPGPDAFFDDPAKLIPVEPPRAKYFNYKLANFVRAGGVPIKARLFAKSPTEAEDAEPGAFMKALGAKLGTAGHGVTVAYFANENDWRVWFSDDLVAAFLGRATTPADLVADGPLHAAKMALIEKAQADGDAAFAGQQASASQAGREPPPPGQRIKLQTDALLDSLILRLEPRP